MKHAIISDIHANPAALERVLADAEQCGAEQVVCAGDVVGYGPYPSETIRILRERNIPTVVGNHDRAVANYVGTGYMIDFARDGVARHRTELGEEDLAWLRSLPYVYLGDGFEVAHASFYPSPTDMQYVHDRLDARDSLFNGRAQRQFIGHTHLEALFRVGFVTDPHYPDSEQLEPHDFKMDDKWMYLINVGSVGYPRVKPYSSYVIFDSATGEVQFRRVDFDFAGYKAALRAKSIPLAPWLRPLESPVSPPPGPGCGRIPRGHACEASR